MTYGEWLPRGTVQFHLSGQSWNAIFFWISLITLFSVHIELSASPAIFVVLYLKFLWISRLLSSLTFLQGDLAQVSQISSNRYSHKYVQKITFK